jgi:hypothetical protein
MKPEIKRLHSPDIFDLENFKPKDPHKFSFLLQVMVGIQGQKGEESFDIEVCTPQWIESTYGLDQVILGLHHIIIREYNYQNIVQVINNFLLKCSGENWDEIARKISRLGRWEFDDYTDNSLT